MRKLSRAVFPACIKGVDREQATVTALVSTRQVDRYGEIILPEAFQKHLPTYQSNPVFLWGHKSYGGPEMVLGRALDVQVVEEGLLATFQFAVDANPTAKMVFDLMTGGYLNAFSIGGVIHGILYRSSDEEAKKALPAYAYEALQDRAASAVITELELYEVSAVGVPANPGALVTAGIDLEEPPRPVLEAILDGVNELLSRVPAPSDPIGIDLEEQLPQPVREAVPAGPAPVSLSLATLQAALREVLAEV